MNEPRNEHSNGTAEMQEWITVMAAHVKHLAPNQLVTVGQDGFYGQSNCMSEMYAPLLHLSAYLVFQLASLYVQEWIIIMAMRVKRLA